MGNIIKAMEELQSIEKVMSEPQSGRRHHPFFYFRAVPALWWRAVGPRLWP
jgi:hypothetical protein